jgi:hypothetical protein
VTRRRWLGAAILAFWVGLLGWQARREYLQPELTRLARATLTLAPGTHFYSVGMGGQAVGVASSRLDTVPEGFLLEDQMNLELGAMGQPGGASLRTTVVLSPTLAMTEFSYSLATDAGLFLAEGQVVGDSLILVSLESGGGVEELRFRVAEAPLSASALPIRLAKGGELRVGRSLRFSIFDPSTVSLRTVEIEVLGHESRLLPDSAVVDPGTGRWIASEGSPIPVWHVRETLGGVSVESWIDEDGRVVSSTSPIGFGLQRTPYELALQEREDTRLAITRGQPQTDVILATAIASNRDLGRPERHTELRFVLSGADLAGFDLDGGRQELRGDTLVIRREGWEDIEPGYSLPYPRMDLAGTLEPEPLIQSGDPRIREEARRVAGIGPQGRGDPRVVAARLTQGVFEMLEKEISFSLPSATRVLDTRRGDCNEHTVLFVAMARSVGLPARVAVGLVYLEGLFLYHAWPEVWLGEWVAVDPTFGQFPADAAHLRFVTGGIAQQVEIARLIGNLRIQVLDSE